MATVVLTISLVKNSVFALDETPLFTVNTERKFKEQSLPVKVNVFVTDGTYFDTKLKKQVHSFLFKHSVGKEIMKNQMVAGYLACAMKSYRYEVAFYDLNDGNYKYTFNQKAQISGKVRKLQQGSVEYKITEEIDYRVDHVKESRNPEYQKITCSMPHVKELTKIVKMADNAGNCLYIDFDPDVMKSVKDFINTPYGQDNSPERTTYQTSVKAIAEFTIDASLPKVCIKNNKDNREKLYLK